MSDLNEKSTRVVGKLRIAYFSPTGNTKYLAGVLKEHLKLVDENMMDLTRVDNSESFKGIHLIMLFSIHGFNPPAKVIEFTRGLRQSEVEAVSFIGVGCNDIWVNQAVTLKLRKLMANYGIPVILDEVVAMPLTFIMNFPDELNMTLIEEGRKSMAEFAVRILKRDASKKQVPLKSKILSTISTLEKPAARFFGLELHANKACTSCGKCYRDCPSGNIKPDKSGRPKFGFRCIMCMKCIYECPEKAIGPYVSKFIPIKGGYSLEKYLKMTKDGGRYEQ